MRTVRQKRSRKDLDSFAGPTIKWRCISSYGPDAQIGLMTAASGVNGRTWQSAKAVPTQGSKPASTGPGPSEPVSNGDAAMTMRC